MKKNDSRRDPDGPESVDSKGFTSILLILSSTFDNNLFLINSLDGVPVNSPFTIYNQQLKLNPSLLFFKSSPSY